MTSWECYENKWFYMKYIGKMAETESLLSTCCTSITCSKISVRIRICKYLYCKRARVAHGVR
jgi:hypothetical protein